MDPTNIASVVVAIVAAGAAVASQRAAANAAVKNTATTTAADLAKSRGEIEKEAYERAERYLDGLIKRQDNEITELRADVDRLNKRVRHLEDDNGSKDEQIRVLAAALAAKGLEA